MEDNILFELDKNNVGTLILNRPHVHNALNEGMIQNLLDLFESLHKRSEIRALILKGTGKSFCAGADISWMMEMSSYSKEENQKASFKLSSMLFHLDQLTFPVLAYAHGAIMGGGIGLLACSDIVLSHPLATFSFPEVKLGLSPSIISPYIVRSIGLRQTRRYFVTGERFSALKAKELGLVHETLDESQNEEETLEGFIQQILKGAPQALRSTKKLIQDLENNITQDISSKTAELNATHRASKECQEGLKAFLEKRQPYWALKSDK